jgi:hypothetical protein
VQGWSAFLVTSRTDFFHSTSTLQKCGDSFGPEGSSKADLLSVCLCRQSAASPQLHDLPNYLAEQRSRPFLAPQMLVS